MKKSLILAALALAFGLAAAEIPVSVTADCWSVNGNIKGVKDAKTGAVTYTISKDSARDKNGKANVWNTQVAPHLVKGLPAGKYVLECKIKCSQDADLELVVFNGKNPRFGQTRMKFAANKETAVKIPFTMTEAWANKAFRLPGIPVGGLKTGATLTISGYKVTKL